MPKKIKKLRPRDPFWRVRRALRAKRQESRRADKRAEARRAERAARDRDGGDDGS